MWVTVSFAPEERELNWHTAGNRLVSGREQESVIINNGVYWAHYNATA